MGEIMKKIMIYDTITETLALLRGKGSIVFASGAFDLFHYGHFRALHRASQTGNFLIVQIDGNRLVKTRKGNGRPHLDELDRATMVASLEFVHGVFISDIPSEDPRTLTSVSPDIFIRAIIPGQSMQERNKRELSLQTRLFNGKVLWLPQTEEVSTTKLLPALRSTIPGVKPL